MAEDAGEQMMVGDTMDADQALDVPSDQFADQGTDQIIDQTADDQVLDSADSANSVGMSSVRI